MGRALRVERGGCLKRNRTGSFLTLLAYGKAFELTGRQSLKLYGFMVAALADDAKSTREDAYGIAAPEVAGHSAENLRNTGSALHAK